jgi:hypothetical protein
LRQYNADRGLSSGACNAEYQTGSDGDNEKLHHINPNERVDDNLCILLKLMPIMQHSNPAPWINLA